MIVNLSLLLFLPMLVGIVVLFVPAPSRKVIYRIALSSSILQFVYLLFVVLQGDFTNFQWNHSIQIPWIESLGIYYALAMDGLSALMCLLTSVTMMIAVAVSYKIEKKVKAYFVLMLLLQTGIYGVFLSVDLFLFYMFWELSLIPLYFLIGIWGGVRREYAAIKFFIYTMVGSIFLLLAMILLYLQNSTGLGIQFTDFAIHQSWIHEYKETIWGFSLPTLLFFAFFIAFGIKIPIFPFHTWLPDAHVQAPTPVSVILAGVLLKLGMYGMLRFSFGFVPGVVSIFAPFIFVIGVINLIYGAFCAMYQKDLKRLIAYSSISHMGYCMIGFAAITFLSLEGSIMQMLSHGLIAAMLFLVAGSIYERTYSLAISDLGGFATNLPKLTFVGVFAVFASVGLPGLFGFVSEFLVLAGSFMGTVNPFGLWSKVDHFFQIGTAVALTTVLITAVYMLWMLQRVFFGPLAQKWSSLQDLRMRDMYIYILLMGLIFWFGIQPSFLLELTHINVQEWMDFVRGAQ